MNIDCSNKTIVQNILSDNIAKRDKAWSCILNKCTDSLKSYLRTRGVTEQMDRDDLVYESIYRLINLLSSGFEINKDVCAILMGVGKNVHHEYLRKEKKDNNLQETYSDILNSLEDDDEKDFTEFNKSFNQLGEKCKMLLDLKYVKGMKMSEMAEMLGRTATGVKTDIQGCKNKLRKMYQ